LQLINPSTLSDELNTTLTPHSMIHGGACFAYFKQIWGIPNEQAHAGLCFPETQTCTPDNGTDGQSCYPVQCGILALKGAPISLCKQSR